MLPSHFGPMNASEPGIVFQMQAPHFGFVLLQLIASSLLMLLQFSILPVLLIYADLRRRILYRIMLSIALSDFLQLYAIWQFTLFEALGFSDWSIAFEKLVSGVYIVAWGHLIVQHFLLALNRLIIILRAYQSPVSPKNNCDSPTEHLLFNSLLVLSWVFLLFLVILFMTPMCGGIWNRQAVGFYYDTRLKCSRVYIDVELYFTIVFPALSLLFYLVIVALLKKTRNLTTVVQVTTTTTANHHQSQTQQQPSVRLLSAQERRILLLSVLLFGIIAALIFAWYIDYRSPPWTLLFCGYLLANSVLSLTMNSEYRLRFVQMLAALFATVVGMQRVNGTRAAVSNSRLNMRNGGGTVRRKEEAQGLFIISSSSSSRRVHAGEQRCGRSGGNGHGGGQRRLGKA